MVGRISSLLFVLGLTAGCAQPLSTSGEDTPPAQALRDGFVSEALSIGASWYTYDGTTHALSPKPESYVVQWDDWARRVRVLSYYDARGESGYFTLAISSAINGGWSEESVLGAPSSVKEAPICLDLRALDWVSCDAPHHLVARTDRRVIPAAGFAVAEPGLYLAGHRARGEHPKLWRIPGDAAGFDPSVVEDAAAHEVPSAFVDPPAAVLGAPATVSLGQTVLHATADMQLCSWTLIDASDTWLDFETRCQPLAPTSEDQRALETTPAVTSRVELPSHDNFAAVYLAISEEGGVEIVDVEDAPRAGLWPSNDTFDLVLEMDSTELLLLAAAGSLVHAPVTTVAGLAIPEKLWE